MKNILMAACCLVMMAGNTVFANTARPGVACYLSSCLATIGADSGKVGKKCVTGDSAGTNCGCTLSQLPGCSTVTLTSGSCGGSTPVLMDYHIDGRKCCGDVGCFKASERELIKAQNMINESIAGHTANLDEVFGSDPSNESRVGSNWGYVNSVIRSDSAGRATAAKAKLDACLYYTDVDAITGADNYEKWTNCVGNTQGCGATGKNEHCNDTGTNDGVSVSAAVCKDRCDCVFGQGTCENQ